jgi:hypothetical protein
LLSPEEILKHNKATRKTRRKRNKVINPSKEKKVNEVNKEEESSEKLKLFPKPIIYDPDKNQRNILLVDIDDNNNFKQDTQQEQITKDAKEITNYYLNLHNNMINTYNSINSQILQDIFNLSYDNFFTISERFINRPSFEIQNMYTTLNSNIDKSLKLIDNIITENLDTFIKSIELTQRFYKDVIESYLNCIKKVEQ